MRTNQIKKKLANGEACRGVWLGIPSPFSARILAQQPVDWLVIDAEHAPVDIQTMALMVAAIADSEGPAPFIRLAQSTVENCKRALDSGAYGLIAPMINTKEEAERVVAWSKFPPYGERSFGSAYAGLAFGVTMSEYLQMAYRETVIAIQIESKTALANLDALMSVPGVDMAFVGPIDLSISLGLDPLPENQHPLFQEALAKIIATAKKHKKPLGIYCSNGDAARRRIAQGFQFVNVTSDINSLTRNVLSELEDSR
jgi:4-hydroxy-2-oxoheptanedioate aldolase